jgi:hypothetical protein
MMPFIIIISILFGFIVLYTYGFHLVMEAHKRAEESKRKLIEVYKDQIIVLRIYRDILKEMKGDKEYIEQLETLNVEMEDQIHTYEGELE